jgi:hypothetical protein
MQLRIAGVYDEERGYRAYKSIEQFLSEELTAKNRGKWFYAHAGGMADLNFVLEKIVEFAKTRAHFNYSVEASFSGSSAIIVHIRQGKNAWHFVDSYWLLRDKLSNIGKWIGLEKGHSVAGWDDMTQAQRKEWYGSVDLQSLLVYNQQDCYILYTAIEQFQETLLSMGGQLQMTLASCAMHLFRRRFLKQDISIPSYVNECARKAYFSSRVEVFQTSCEDAYYYDINSSFPYAMTFPCPGQFLGSQLNLPKRPEVLYIADVDIKVPDSYLPPLPYRMQGRVFFPVGTWRSWLTQVDLELLLQNGGQLLKVHECLGFEPFDDLKEYAETFYAIRKNSSNEFEKVTGKLLMNSLYGKFGEGSEKQTMHINPSETSEWRLRDKETEGRAEMLFPGAWIETIDADVPHMHVPIAAHITSFARRTLYNFLKPCEQVYYSDTDSVVTTSTLPTSKELGGLKLEYRVRGGDFYSPKLYRLHAEEDGKEKTVYRAKGFSLDSVDITDDESVTAERDLRGDERTNAIREINFDKIINHDEVRIERMTRIRELYRKGRTKPEESIITKGIRNKLIPWEPLPNKSERSITKRFMYPDGDSRPWGLEELTDILS